MNIQERPRLRLRLIGWLVAAALTVTGCDRPDADADPAARLQALGYVEWVEVDEKDGVMASANSIRCAMRPVSIW